MAVGRTGSPSRRMPRAIAPDVTTTTSVPARCRPATSSHTRATPDRRSSPESSAMTDDPSLTTTTGMRRLTIESRRMPSASSPPQVEALRDEGRFDGRGGATIAWQGWVPPSPRAVVVVAHGAGEHGGRYRYVVERLVPERFAVYAIDHRGHGRSSGRRAQIDRMAHVVADLDVLVGEVERRHPSLPRFLLGHSLGGAV